MWESGEICIRMNSDHALAAMDTWLFWKMAIPLAQAYLRFAPQGRTERYQDLLGTHSWHSIPGRVLERISDGVDGWAALQDFTSQPGQLHSLIDELRSDCVRHVHTGALNAYGFAVPRTPADLPRLVPPDLWSGTVRWERSILECNGLKMEGIRLIPPHWEDQLVTRQVTSSDRTGPGRRSRESQILEAFDALCESGQIDFTKPMKWTFEPIRSRVLAKYPEDPDGAKGLSDKTIAKTIRVEFTARKSDSKL